MGLYPVAMVMDVGMLMRMFPVAMVMDVRVLMRMFPVAMVMVVGVLMGVFPVVMVMVVGVLMGMFPVVMVVRMLMRMFPVAMVMVVGMLMRMFPVAMVMVVGMFFRFGQFHTKIIGIDAVFVGAGKRQAISIYPERGKAILQRLPIGAQIQQGRNGHIAADAGITFKIQFFCHGNRPPDMMFLPCGGHCFKRCPNSKSFVHRLRRK